MKRYIVSKILLLLILIQVIIIPTLGMIVPALGEPSAFALMQFAGMIVWLMLGDRIARGWW